MRFCLLAIVSMLFTMPCFAQDSVEEPTLVEPTAIEQERMPAPRKPPGNRMGGMGGGPGGMGGAPGYSVEWFPNRPVSGQNTNFTLVRQNLNLGAPIWKGEEDMLIATLRVGHTLVSTDAILPDTRRPFPKDLWNLNLGLNYMHQFENGWSGGLIFGIGSASDKPFQTFDEVAVNLGGFLKVPARNDRDSWQFSLFYAPMGAVNFPLPGVSYNWNPTEKFRMNIGLPFTLHWEPTEDWTLDLMYVPLLNVNAKVHYRVFEQLRFYAGYEFGNESYFLADRLERQDRFFILEQRVLGGWLYNVTDIVSVDFKAGYAFDRRVGEGQNQLSNLKDRLNIASGAFLGLQVGLRF
jgi:hypothetical protein